MENKGMKKYVLTGGPCCGKTTTIKELSKRGFPVAEEVAREVMEERKRFTPNQQEWELREEIILQRQLERESKNPVFLDRGVLDIIVYSEHLLGYFPYSIEKSELRNRYSKIFILDLLPFEDDGLRIETGNKEAKELHQKVISAYRDYGYKTIRVPVMPIKQRVDYVLERTEDEDGIQC